MESYKKRDRSRSPGVAERNDAEPVKIKKRLVKVKRLRTRERSLEDQDRAQGSGPSTVGSPSAGPSKRPEREHESRDSRRSRAEPSTRSRIPSPAPRVVGYSSDEQKEEEMGPVLGPEREPRPFSPPREISSPRRQIPFVSGPSTPPPPRPNPLLGDCRSVFNYTRLNHIADGAYGTVYRAKCNDTGGIYALKKLKLEPQEEAQGYPTISLAEVSAVMVVRDHENIVDVREIVVGDKLTQVFIVMPFIEHDLKTLVETMPHPFSQSEVKTLMKQLLSAVGYCHDRMILHRDLKTSNLLLTNRGQLKVADFGLARKYTEPPGEMTQLVVTLWYRSPELLLGTKVYSTAIDVWSIGCIFAELMQKEPLFPGRGEIDQIKRIFDLLGKPTEQMWPGFSRLPITRRINPVGPPYSSLRKKYQYLTSAGYDLLAGLLRYDPKQRISAVEGLEHPYFEESPYPKHPDMFPSFPSTAAGEKRHKIQSPPAPARAKSKAESKPYQMVFDFSS